MTRRFEAMIDVSVEINKAADAIGMAEGGVMIVVEGEKEAIECLGKLTDARRLIQEVRQTLDHQKYGFLLTEF